MEDSPGPTRSKSISQLHFNAINNATSNNAATAKQPHKKYSGSTASADEHRQLLAASQQKQFIIMPAASISRSGTSTPHYYLPSPGPLPANGMASGNSSLAPSAHNSPMGSPTASRPRHMGSMRSVRSGKRVVWCAVCHKRPIAQTLKSD